MYLRGFQWFILVLTETSHISVSISMAFLVSLLGKKEHFSKFYGFSFELSRAFQRNIASSTVGCPPRVLTLKRQRQELHFKIISDIYQQNQSGMYCPGTRSAAKNAARLDRKRNIRCCEIDQLSWKGFGDRNPAFLCLLGSVSYVLSKE